ncbi:hypothetical protein CcaverHIS002_0603000 [Cutaneotrichosporon cavernicola]|uniref:Amino acid transporter n=1 Tax=Cutaneotrichosporon cavernicola TaxID=279322 RepID=A0AA48L894_9TREE|nr:uncharacterized protein CcaverHIS019_0602470 [Cutaneotrichosporon cavernicola]BEI86013.1 hypothetical protein CcaverHIS002_0603000 [Cutaneotrichosporon cavernicola]BEI93788.1 hypothetical protein CcaverHIS019_0602470 [Cutaneotrichosporon cavernicola]BEJ01565.1 hypothetical protein CcaverHIS631_0602470 [Cutaneotrichosporon cavernicola]BEJ09331.1 hypothetical protein CcaverHIS641_0602460 [Cutaneotrichosporon cavernicola]
MTPERQPLLPPSEVGVHEPALERNFSFIAALGLAFTLLNTWTAMAAALPVGLQSGGPVVMLYGLILSVLGQTFVAVSLAEVCHVLPMSGGQYDWAYLLAPPKWRRPLSFVVGWLACAGWVTLFAAAAALTQSLFMGVLVLWSDTLPARWHEFALIISFVLASFFLNAFAWPNALAFLLGMLQSTLTTSSFDAVTHLVEEMPQPARNAPMIMVLAPITGGITAWPFMLVLLFCLKSWDGVLGSAIGPVLEIYRQSTESRVGATSLMLINVVAMFFCTQSVLTISSRMVMSFARDRGLANVSRFISPISARLNVPFNSLVFVTAWVIIFALIYLGSTVALNAIMSSAIFFLQLSYAVPLLLLLFRGEAALTDHRPEQGWSLGRWRRPINIVALVFLAVTSTVFLLPPFLPVTAENMNYAVVVFAIVLVMCAVAWFIDGRDNFQGPTEVEERLVAAKAA